MLPTVERFEQCASRPEETRGRLVPEPESLMRTVFQRDRDRIIHSGAFRRLKHKTQVFVYHEGDYYRTRLTHSIEVAQIARSISRALGFNEDLAEALALAHDLGHPPFGHAGEEALDRAMSGHGGFDHNEQTFRVLTLLERRYAAFDGLNLTWEVRDGIGRHSKGKRGSPVGVDPAKRSATLEGQIMRVADLIAYVNHDIDDAIRAGMLTTADLPAEPVRVLGDSSSQRIARMVKDVVTESQNGGLTEIRMSEPVLEATLVADDFHARFSAIERRYLYRIVNRRAPLTLDVGRAWHVTFALDEAAMQRAAQRLVGQHDFTSFRAAECQAKSPVKTLDALDVVREGDEIRIAARARSFLHHQVRNMVGTLKLVGEGKWTRDDVMHALGARNRAAAGPTAPAEGLYLMDVRY